MNSIFVCHVLDNLDEVKCTFTCCWPFQ